MSVDLVVYTPVTNIMSSQGIHAFSKPWSTRDLAKLGTPLHKHLYEELPGGAVTAAKRKRASDSRIVGAAVTWESLDFAHVLRMHLRLAPLPSELPKR